MLALAFLCIILIIVENATASAATAFDDTVNYQIHSNNDVRELRQLLLKGASRFKFDPHYMDAESCKQIGVVNSKGCLLLNHDDPLTRFSNYSTSDDLIDFFKSEYFQKMRMHLNVSFTAAFCFKSAPDKCQNTSTAWNNWLALADEFFERAKNEVTGVEFILDGDAKPTSCLIGRWPELNSVWISTSSPQAAFTSNSQTNDYYRYQIINDPESISNWTWMAEQNYGKFSDPVSQYPYQLWEPDLQSDYIEYINIYQSSTSHPHLPGFHFAINTDLAMFELYVAERTGRGYNSLLQANASSSSSLAVLVRKSSAATTTSSPSLPLHLHLLVNKDPASDSWIYKTVSVNSIAPFYDVTMNEQQTLPPASGPTTVGSFTSLRTIEIENDDKLNFVVFLLSDGNLRVHSADYSDQKVSLGYGVMVSLDKQSGVIETFEDLILIQSDDLTANSFTVITLSTNSKNQASLRKYNVAVDVSSTGVLQQATALYISSVELISSANANNKIISAKVASIAMDDTVFDLVVALSISDVVIMKQITLHLASFTSTFESSFVSVTVGRSLSIDSYNDVIILLNDFGYCYNSHTHNTRSYPNVCSSQPTPSELVIDLSMGLVEDWKSLLKSSDCVIDLTSTISQSTPKCHAVTSCNDDIVHASINQGSKPSVNLGSDMANGSLYFIDVHGGVPTSKKIDNGCGAPNLIDGLVLESLPLQKWLNNLEYKNTL